MKTKLLGMIFVLFIVSLATSPASASLECARSCIEANANCYTLCGDCPFDAIGTCQNYNGCYYRECNCRPDLC
jgi:hypothetical protein